MGPVKRNIAITCCSWLLCTTLHCQETKPPIDPKGLGVCAAIQLKERTENVYLRATGAFSRDGSIVVGDSTCLRGRKEEREETGYLSAYIIVRTELSEEKKDAASQLRWMSEHFPGRQFQILAAGTLTCVQLKRAVDQTIGNGFGRYGRIPCEFLVSSIKELQVLK